MLIINVCVERPDKTEEWDQYVCRDTSDEKAFCTWLRGALAVLRGHMNIYIHHHHEEEVNFRGD